MSPAENAAQRVPEERTKPDNSTTEPFFDADYRGAAARSQD
jgi:hypothetical protein